MCLTVKCQMCVTTGTLKFSKCHIVDRISSAIWVSSAPKAEEKKKRKMETSKFILCSEKTSVNLTPEN